MRPSGAHTHHDGGGAGGAAVAVLALMIVAAFARPLLHVIDGLGHALAELLHVLFIAAAALTGTALIAGAGFAAYKLRRRHNAPAYTATVLSRSRARRGDVLPPRAYVRRPELGGPAEVHLHLHGLTPDQAAEAIARHAQQATWPGQEGEELR